MRHIAAFALIALAATAAGAAPPDYRTIRMEIDVARPAGEVWDKVGHFCDIRTWLSVDCKIVSGDGGIGTVRSLANGRVLEILVGKTGLSYGYTQPFKGGAFYNLYHGYVEARPVSRTTSKIIYTLLYDASDKPDEASKQRDMAERRKRFEAALEKMKQIAEQ
jgi:hypothetical protein